jgi:hypothetical protein
MTSVILSQNTALNEVAGMHLQWSATGFTNPISEIMLTYVKKSGTSNIVSLSIDPQLEMYSLLNLDQGVEYLFELQVTADTQIAYSNTLDLVTSQILAAPVIASTYGVDGGMVFELNATQNILTNADKVEFILRNGASIFWVIKPYSASNSYTLSNADDNRIVNYQNYVVACLFDPAANNAYYKAPSVVSNSIAATPRDYPDPVQNLALLQQDHALTASWNVPADYNGYSADYDVIVGIAPVSTGQYVYTTIHNGGTQYTYSNLDLVQYKVQVYYRNEFGDGAVTESAPKQPYEKPNSPQNIQAAQTDGHFVVSWQAPSNAANYSFAGYKIELYASTDGGINYGAAISTETIMSLSKDYSVNASEVGKMYKAIVKTKFYDPNSGAVLEADQSAQVINTIFKMPTGGDMTLVAQDQAIMASWVKATNPNNACIFQYYNILKDGVQYAQITNINTLSQLISGLVNAQSYTIKLQQAYLPPANYANQSILIYDADVASEIPFGVPAAPDLYSVVAGDEQISLAWNAPNSNGRNILSYDIYADDVLVDNVAANTLTYIYANLDNGVEYAMKIVANNLAGSGAASAEVSAIPYGACSIVSHNKSSKHVDFVFQPNGSSFKKAYIVAVDNSLSPQETPLVILDATPEQQAILTGTLSLRAEFASLLSNDVVNYLIIAMSDTSSAEAVNWV